jgi:putative ABC transport system ATP-binding protein
MQLLRRLSEEEQQTIVLVTHDEGIGRSAPRLVVMRDGRLHQDNVQGIPGPRLQVPTVRHERV